MLKVNICDSNSHKCVEVTASGHVDEIIIDSAIMCAGLHANLKKTDPKLARLFRSKLIQLLTDPDSPVWDAPPSENGVVIIAPDIKKRRLNNV